jgi:hypothetical protein
MCRPALKSKSKSRYSWQSVSQSVSQYVQASSPIWDLRPDITFCPKVVFWKLLSCHCRAPSLMWSLPWRFSAHFTWCRAVCFIVAFSAVVTIHQCGTAQEFPTVSNNLTLHAEYPNGQILVSIDAKPSQYLAAERKHLWHVRSEAQL